MTINDERALETLAAIADAGGDGLWVTYQEIQANHWMPPRMLGHRLRGLERRGLVESRGPALTARCLWRMTEDAFAFIGYKWA